MKRTVADITRLMGPKNRRNVKREFCDVGPITEARAGDLAFCVKRGRDATPTLEKAKASVVICGMDILPQKAEFDGKTRVAVDKSILWFIRRLNAFFQTESKKGAHPTAVVGKNCEIGKDVHVRGVDGFVWHVAMHVSHLWGIDDYAKQHSFN
jgi:UDP-3-O-[3-hydroxymyristoyl] glucosamine N-acyltransferase